MKLAPEEAAERRRARDRAKSKRRKAERRAAKLAAPPPAGAPQNTKTSATYRRMLPQMREMSKHELRQMLTQAVINTGRV